VQGVLADLEAAIARDPELPLFDLRIEEFLNAAALQANQVIVVTALVQLEHRFARLEMVADQQPRLLELRQHAVHRRQADVDTVGQQLLVDILGGQMPDLALLEQVDDPQPRQQVRIALGTPLRTDAFHANRWDYVYEFRRQGRMLEHRQFTVYFVDDRLARWEGDEMPPPPAEVARAGGGDAVLDKSLSTA